MLTKALLFFSFIVNIYSIKFSFFGFMNYKGVVYNPYRVFGLPPWTSMKKIKKRYNELVRKYHPDKSHKDTRKEFELVQQSFDAIKKKRKESDENEVEMSFSNVITGTISSIVNIEALLLLVYLIAYVTFKFQMLIVVPLIFMIISFTTIDNLFPHWFDSESYEYLVCFIVGIGLYILYRKYMRGHINNLFKTTKSKTN